MRSSPAFAKPGTRRSTGRQLRRPRLPAEDPLGKLGMRRSTGSNLPRQRPPARNPLTRLRPLRSRVLGGCLARGPSGKALFGKSCVGNKGLMVRQIAKNLVSGRFSRGEVSKRAIPAKVEWWLMLPPRGGRPPSAADPRYSPPVEPLQPITTHYYPLLPFRPTTWDVPRPDAGGGSEPGLIVRI